VIACAKRGMLGHICPLHDSWGTDVDRAGSKRGKNHGESSSVALPLLVRFFSSLREVTSSALACHQALSEVVEFSRLDGACKQAQMG
jgi:hypothetical protein